MSKYQNLSFVVPAYNEEKNIRTIIDKIQSLDYGVEKELVIVNDWSKDSTAQILKEFEGKEGFKILHNEKNLGKSQSVRRGIVETTGDLVVIQDADSEYDPSDLLSFVEKFQNSDVDLIYGNRFGKNNKVIYIQNWIGNTALSFFSSLFTGLRAGIWTRDMEVCYKMSKGDIFREIGKTIESKSTFGLEPEMTSKFSKYKIKGKHLKFYQIPISYYPRTFKEGKKMHAFKDGMKALIEIIKFNLR